MFSTLVTVWMLWCLGYNRIPRHWLISGLAVITVLLLSGYLKHRREKESLSRLDIMAVGAEQSRINPYLKVGTILFVLVMTLHTESVKAEGLLFVVASALTIFFGSVSVRQYVRLLLPPLLFIGVSGLGLLLSYQAQPTGLLSYPFFKGYLVMTAETQEQTTSVIIRAIAAVSCLYTLQTTTGMTELIEVFRKLKVPDIVTELMYLMYRYIFIFFLMVMEMKKAAASRLGYRTYRISLRTTGAILSHLFTYGLMQALRSFEAMESRCYQGKLRFWTEEKPVTAAQAVGAAVICLSSAAVVVLF
ncbi:MAG: cobalt ECF transporter T component CbiQ [Lachnospiraceae bacterium]|nr:cobalt ECF transporter T component CbiQ [Lachnospiraceae bacterium]MDY5741872.1 cobalt ECF transporter T component CbiQ [Lachnospiraceae bacterium]